MTPTRVFICDDSDGIRLLVRMVLADADGFEVVGEAADGGTLLSAVADARPDVVLLDVHLPDRNGFSLISDLRTVTPAARIVVFTCDDDPSTIDRARALADGYVTKASTAHAVLSALRGPLASPAGGG